MMRILLGGIILLSACLVAISAQAQNPWVLYDDFNSEFMDINNWNTSQRIDAGVTILEYVRELHGGRFHMMSRAFGRIAEPPGNPPNAAGDINANFSVGEPFKSLKVSVKVNDVEVTDCLDSNTTPSYSRARLVGFFFKIAKDGTQPEGRTDDILVQIRIQRSSDSADKPQLLEVLGEVVKCTDSQCLGAIGIGIPAVSLGNIMLGQWATIEIDWNGYTQFNLNLNKEPTHFFNVTIPDGYHLGRGTYPAATLGVSHRIANCPSDERAMGLIDAEFDNLFISEYPNP